jgi:hypothetical protein
MRRSIVISIVWLTACAVLTAAEFWEEKELTDWSDREVQRLMTNSPWAKRITVVFPRPPRETINDRAPTARLGGGGGGRGARSGFGQFGAAAQSRLIVQWRSALPMRQAIVRGRVGPGGALGSAERQFLAQRPDVYFIVVSGLPRAFARLDPRALRAEARLERRGKPPILPIQANPQPDGDGTALVYVFPQVEAITLEDEEVEFVTEVADASIERTFELEDMVVDGVLEL